MKKIIIISLAVLFTTSSSSALDISVSSKQGYLTKQNEFKGFGCAGENKSPQLEIKNIPKETKSLAITLYDPDAPTGGGWWHWLAVNIPTSKRKLSVGAEGLNKIGVMQTMNSYGASSFGGACPPRGDTPHRYIFTVYALNVKSLDVKPSTTPNIVGYQLNANSIAKATSTVLYGR